jgi:hypothetical protein
MHASFFLFDGDCGAGGLNKDELQMKFGVLGQLSEVESWAKLETGFHRLDTEREMLTLS